MISSESGKTLKTSMTNTVPVVCQIPKFDKSDMKTKLVCCAHRDNEFYTSVHDLSDVKLRDTFNDDNTQNKRHVEEDVYPTFDVATPYQSDLKTSVLLDPDVHTQDTDVCQIMIVTGNWTRVPDLEGDGNLCISKCRQLVTTRFDRYWT
jgi:hypothetical protein